MRDNLNETRVLPQPPPASTEPPSAALPVCYPPSILLIHPKERRSKCSLEPLRGRPDLRFIDFDPKCSLDLTGYVRLNVSGEPLSAADSNCGILLIDGSWRHAERMQARFTDVPARSLPGYRTAYPRTSKLFRDPPDGLASIEALYIAYHLLGRFTEGLLDSYLWRDKFLEMNAEAWRRA